MPIPLIKQLKVGGQLILPVGAVGKKQNMMVITKVDENGKFVTKKLLDVMYGPLTSPEE